MTVTFSGRTFRCDICKRERAEADISTVKREVAKVRLEQLARVTVSVAVNFCNDNPDCAAKAAGDAWLGQAGLPADVNQIAKRIVDEATGDEPKPPPGL